MQTPWLAKAEETFYPALNEDIETDVCVIGGGITGLTTAFLLQEKGRRVCVLERHTLASGVSGHTSGHMTSLVDTYYQRLVSEHSLDTAKTVYAAATEARKTVERLIAENAMDAGYERTPAYYYATDDKQLEMLRNERQALEKMGVNVEDADVSVLPFAVKDIFKVEDQAVINVPLYVRNLARIFTERGGVIHENTAAVNFHRANGFVEVETEQYHVRARDVVHATHTPLKIHPVQLELKNYNSYVLAGASAMDVKPGLFYDFSEPYNYIRHYHENGELKYVIGGFDNKTGTQNNEQENANHLLRYASQNFGVEKADYCWSSMFFAPSDGLPFIGEDPLSLNTYMATGFSGDGLTFGVVSAILNTGLITSNDHPWKDVFTPARFNLSSAPDLLKKAVETAKFLVLDRFQLDGVEIESIGAGHGRIVTMNGKKLGVAVDENHQVHLVNPTCSHMKCMVHWNNVANTWDCACHGSRYGLDGEVISGPATKGLQRIEMERTSDSDKEKS